MNYSYKVVSLIVVLFTFSGLPAHANKDVSKAEFLQVTQYMMIEPCTISAYMSCLKITQDACQKSVKKSFKTCDDKVKIPNSIPRATIQKVINSYGGCMTGEISRRMKLTEAKLNKCESVLRANVKKPAKKH